MRGVDEIIKSQTIPNLSYVCQQIKLMSSNVYFNSIFKTNRESVLDAISTWKDLEEEKRKKKEQTVVRKSPKALVDTNILLQHMIDPKQYELDKKKEREKQELIEKDRQQQIHAQQQALIEKKRLEEEALAATKVIPEPIVEIPVVPPQIIIETIDVQKELTKEEIVKFNLSTGKDEDIFYNNIDDDDENNFINYIPESKEPISLSPARSPVKQSSSDILKIELNISKPNSSASLIKPPEVVPIQIAPKYTPPKHFPKEFKDNNNKDQNSLPIVNQVIKPPPKVVENPNPPSTKEMSSKFNICLIENPSPPKHSSSNVIKISNMSNPSEDQHFMSGKQISNFGNKDNVKQQRTSKIILEDEEEESLHKEDKKENDDKSGCEMNNTKIRIMLGPAGISNDIQQDESLLKKKIRKENATPISLSSRSEGPPLKSKYELSNDSYLPLKEREVPINNSRKLTNSRIEIKPITTNSGTANNFNRDIPSTHTTTSFTKQPPISIPDPKKKDPTVLLTQRLEIAINEVKQKIIGFSLEDVDLENFNKSLIDIYEKVSKLPEVSSLLTTKLNS